jgi:hypothetical protein
VGVVSPNLAQVAPLSPQGPAARLAELKAMMDQGLITPDEYEGKKREILSNL